MGDAETKMPPPIAYCNIDSIQEEQEDEDKEEVVDYEFLDPTQCEFNSTRKDPSRNQGAHPKFKTS